MCRITRFVLFVSSCLLLLILSPQRLLAAQHAERHTTTNWVLRPSLKYDALCLLNALSGDPYYLQFYQAEYDHFRPLFTAEEQAAFQKLKQVIKDEGQGIISARLSLYFSAVDDETLPEMIHTAQDSSRMEAALRKTPYWGEEEWKNYEQARPALEAALRGLERVGFAAYWEQSAKPKIAKRIAQLTPDLPKCNIVPLIENYLGTSFASDTITVYLLAYSEPHGIRITGLRYLTHMFYPFEIVLHNAIHEAMHPPYRANEPQVKQAIEMLGRDPLVADKVKHHDPSFGYNTPEGYIEEDSVQALEQIVSEDIGMGRDTRAYWKEQDGGIHVLAAAIYVRYRLAIKGGAQPYSKWFVQAVTDGQLREEKLRSTVDNFFSGKIPQ